MFLHSFEVYIKQAEVTSEGKVEELTFQGSNNVHNILIAEDDIKNMSIIEWDCKQVQSRTHTSLRILT